MPMHLTKEQIRLAMFSFRENGGDFLSALVTAWARGDQTNRQCIENAYADRIIAEYERLVLGAAVTPCLAAVFFQAQLRGFNATTLLISNPSGSVLLDASDETEMMLLSDLPKPLVSRTIERVQKYLGSTSVVEYAGYNAFRCLCSCGTFDLMLPKGALQLLARPATAIFRSVTLLEEHDDPVEGVKDLTWTLDNLMWTGYTAAMLDVPDGEHAVFSDVLQLAEKHAQPYTQLQAGGFAYGDPRAEYVFAADRSAIEELPHVEDSDEAKQLGTDCVHVNDHGNITVFGGDGSVLLERV